MGANFYTIVPIQQYTLKNFRSALSYTNTQGAAQDAFSQVVGEESLKAVDVAMTRSTDVPESRTLLYFQPAY